MNVNEIQDRKKRAIENAILLKKASEESAGGFILEYKPEDFQITEIDDMLEVCNAVLDIWKPTPDQKASIVIPISFWSPEPQVFAYRVEYIYKHLKYRDSVNLSMYPYNESIDNQNMLAVTIHLNGCNAEADQKFLDLYEEHLAVTASNDYEENIGDAAFVLKKHYGIALPKTMQEDVNRLINGELDHSHEFAPKDIYRIFENTYLNNTSVYDISECHFVPKDGIVAKVTISQNTESRTIVTMGNGRLDAVSNAVKMYFGIEYELASYEEHAIGSGSASKAAAFVSVVSEGNVYWGVGIDEDIIKSSIEALVSATNKLLENVHITEGREERIVNIMNYIQNNYQNVTLDVLVEQFHLTKPYLSKYIKMKSGMTFQEVVKAIRMKKARILLKESNQTVESIAAAVGYENVEHFNRLFKKIYNMTPGQYQREG